jgi:hypothetical protein
LDYDATFRKDGLYLYHGTDLVHYTPKSPDTTSWTLPLQRPRARANAVLSLPSEGRVTRRHVFFLELQNLEFEKRFCRFCVLLHGTQFPYFFPRATRLPFT